ncbi:MAG: VWD domain-containing protein [Sideroxyarcus sp.]
MKLKHIMVFWLAFALAGVTNPARAYICDNAQFFDQCPTADPAFLTMIANDFKIRRDGVLIDPTTLTCTAPISTMAISAYTDEIVLLQALRAIYFMDLGRSNHLPWTTKTLYGWLKEKVGGFEISTTSSYDYWGGPMYSGQGDSANYFVIRAKNDTTREFQKKWAGPVGISTMITLMMHERRHGDGPAFSHLRCCPAQDPANPNNACDQTYEETANLSAYGIQYWLEKYWVNGFINVGVGCMTPVVQADAINWMRQDGNAHAHPASSNYCTNTPPLLTAANNAPAGCNCTGLAGSSSGEPHIATLDGLFYDFQAAGDFLLVENGPSFIVQVRQQWTPNRPNVAFNKAVAMRMGKTRVAVFLDPTRLVVDGKQVALADGKTLTLPDNVEVTRNANVYVIKRSSGETVRVTAIDNAWVNILGGHFMDVAVSLNYSAYGGMRGLLGNGNGDVQDDIATRDGKVLAQPVSFENFYHQYGASMSIQPKESLFGENRRMVTVAVPDVAVKNVFEAPKKPYTVKNLAPREYKPARAACIKAGVKDQPLLDACTLDVAVLRSPEVAKLYTGIAPPAAVMEPGVGIRNILPAKCRINCIERRASDIRR